MKKITLILGVAIILCLIIYAIIGVYEKKETKTLAFEPLDQELAHLDVVYDKWFAEPIDVLATENGTRVVCNWHQYLALSSKKSEGHSDALKQFNDEAMDFVVNHGIRSLYWASLQAANDIIALRSSNIKEAREELLLRCKVECPKLEEKLDDNLEAFDNVARAEGFFDNAGTIRTEKMPLIRLLHRQIWNKAASEKFPLDNIQAPEESRLFYLWAIEGSQRNAQKKFALIDKYKTSIDNDYEDNYAKAILFLQMQDRASACEALKMALKEPKRSEVQKQKYRDGLKLVNALKAEDCDITALAID